MKGFHSLPVRELAWAFYLIGKEWLLITASGKDETGKEITNTMTASWGGVGILWNRPVAFCFIRPQRYTFTLTEQADRFSLSVLPEGYRAALQLCGTRSGRDTDKFREAGLTPSEHLGVPYPAEARLVLVCRKLYADDLKKDCFVDPTLLGNYKANDFHRMYVIEIEEVWEKDGAKSEHDGI